MLPIFLKIKKDVLDIKIAVKGQVLIKNDSKVSSYRSIGGKSSIV